MQISNEDLARILGRIEGKLDEQTNVSKRLEGSIAGLDAKVSRRLDEHDLRLRELEVANPKALKDRVDNHEERIRSLENGAAKAGVIAGVGSSVAVAALIELVKRKLGL
ncbi:hypothetical protein [Herbaspirillum sp. ST 5-3]|uniref:hypothetical protein n=1 Tax=Oxalobacteraceae TaxID=75682 RepID=UPI0010A4795C|nr:hypothetical protein [Herbaspirillum sp. ST 5-3]